MYPNAGTKIVNLIKGNMLFQEVQQDSDDEDDGPDAGPDDDDDVSLFISLLAPCVVCVLWQ